MKPTFYYNIDILGSCNLACPTCPQGNSDVAIPNKLMDVDLFRQILNKAERETTVSGVGLFNWTEPMLHPKCGEFVRELKLRKIPCHLSTNLNVIRNLKSTLNEDPTTLRISVSGFTQENYKTTHAKGDIEVVKANMLELSTYLRNNPRLTTVVAVLFHRYKHNADDEVLMREYSMRLGFRFDTVEAYIMPLETVIKRWDRVLPPMEIEAKLLNSLDSVKPLCKKVKGMSCHLQIRELTVDCLGDVHTCCALFDPKLSRIGNFLSSPVAEIQDLKFKSKTCTRCIASGGHAYSTYLWKFKGRLLHRAGNLRAVYRSMWASIAYHLNLRRNYMSLERKTK
jgi:MoaA/NifB/PqqE/SkfB family radical SAM enzyme